MRFSALLGAVVQQNGQQWLRQCFPSCAGRFSAMRERLGIISRVPAALKTIVSVFASMIVGPSALAGFFLIWGRDYGDAAKVLGVVALSIFILLGWKQYLPRPKEQLTGSGTEFFTIIMWIVASSLALGGVVSFTLHDSNNALVELGAASVIFMIIWLRRRRRLAGQA
jgi:hypothetical protein